MAFPGMDSRNIYRALYRIRRVEEEIARVYPSDKIQSPVHLSIGQEAVSVGVSCALKHNDVVFGTYRGHAMYLAKGGNLKKMIAELYGKATGAAKGKGGSMHLIDAGAGVMGTSAIVGTTIPHAVGFGYALKLRREARIAVVFFGDGAADEGVFHESLNFAALKRLPVLFVCENNSYAIHSRQKDRQARPDLSARARSYGIRAERLRNNNLKKIYESAARARAELLKGKGPVFLECETYRWREHVGPNEDYAAGYRTRKELAPWVRSDEVVRFGRLLESRERSKIERAVEAEIIAAFRFAESSPFPKPEELYTDLLLES